MASHSSALIMKYPNLDIFSLKVLPSPDIFPLNVRKKNLANDINKRIRVVVTDRVSKFLSLTNGCQWILCRGKSYMRRITDRQVPQHRWRTSCP